MGSSGGGGGGNPPATPSGLTAAPGNAQVSLTWNAVTTASSYNLKRATTSGGPYNTIASPGTTGYTDTSLTNGTAYYYVVSAVNGYGESANSSQVSGTPLAPPATPTGLTATPGNVQVSLNWNTVAGASSYHVKRSAASGGPYTTIASSAGTAYADSSVSNGTTYYYVVSAVNAGGESGNSSQVSAMPTGPSTSISVTIDVLANRHAISPYVYGGAFPKDAATISDSGVSVVRWGGNASSTYNWQLFTDNADNDYYFEDFAFGALNNSADSDSTQFIKDVNKAGSAPLMTMVMLPWVAQSAETSQTQGGIDNYHWTFSVSRDGACSSKVDQYNVDAGVNLMSDCATAMVASSAQINRAYYPLLDDHTQTCPVATCVYRSDWAAALATAFGSGLCPIPYSSITSCHFYDMDNEIDIWGGTHVDVHPNATTYDELRDIYLTEAGKLKGWDSQAVRMGWVSCCWYYYWNSAAGDKGTHANIDFMPWWLNEVAWQDAINGGRTLDILDLHAYPETSFSTFNAQAKALVLRSTRDWWDPSYTSEAWFGTNSVTAEEPFDGRAFRIPRARAWANAIYPGTPLAFTEWNFDLGNDSDFSTALADVDAYGILGRERASLSTRWTTPNPSAPNYQALKLYTKYDGTHGFGTTSVEATNDGDPGLFSSYAALNSSGTVLTIMVVNKDPANTAQVSFATNGFTPTNVTTYTLSQGAPNQIVAGSAQPWSGTVSFAPYSATLLVVNGSLGTAPSAEWDLNPDTIMVPASGTVTLHPTMTSGAGTVSLSNAIFDGFEGAAACSGSLNITTSAITATVNGAIVVNAPSTPGFCHFTVTGSDSGGATQTQGGWIVVGKPAATFSKSGDGQSGPGGSQLTLSVTLNPGSSGGTQSGASVLFTSTAGSVSNGTNSGTTVIAVTNSSGVASITLTLPSSAQTVTVTAEGPYGLGHPVAAFTETAN